MHPLTGWVISSNQLLYEFLCWVYGYPCTKSPYKLMMMIIWLSSWASCILKRSTFQWLALGKESRVQASCITHICIKKVVSISSMKEQTIQDYIFIYLCVYFKVLGELYLNQIVQAYSWQHVIINLFWSN